MELTSRLVGTNDVQIALYCGQWNKFRQQYTTRLEQLNLTLFVFTEISFAEFLCEFFKFIVMRFNHQVLARVERVTVSSALKQVNCVVD